jgi:uncharacterized membrane protein
VRAGRPARNAVSLAIHKHRIGVGHRCFPLISGALLLWYVLVRYNESSEKFSVV